MTAALLLAITSAAAGQNTAPAWTSGSSQDASKASSGMIFSFVPRIYGLTPTEGTGQRLIVTYSIPADRVRGPGSTDYRARVKLTLVAQDGDTVVRVDSIRTLIPLADKRSGVVVGLEEVDLAPGRYDLGLYLGRSDSRVGIETVSRVVDVADLAHESLWVSDLILGHPEDPLGWRREGVPVSLDPLQAFPPGGSIELYYEVVGLPAGAPFQTTVSLTPMGDYGLAYEAEQPPLVAFVYDEVADARFTPLRRTLQLGDLPPGRYRLTVGAAQPGQPEVDRSATIRVLGQ